VRTEIHITVKLGSERHLKKEDVAKAWHLGPEVGAIIEKGFKRILAPLGAEISSDITEALANSDTLRVAFTRLLRKHIADLEPSYSIDPAGHISLGWYSDFSDEDEDRPKPVLLHDIVQGGLEHAMNCMRDEMEGEPSAVIAARLREIADKIEKS
jgi:hypothetical protein